MPQSKARCGDTKLVEYREHRYGRAHLVSFSDEIFLVNTRFPHDHWPPKSWEMFSVKSVIEGSEEYRIDRESLELRRGTQLIFDGNREYASRSNPGKVAYCPIYFKPSAAMEIFTYLRTQNEGNLLDGRLLNPDLPSFLLPSNPILTRCFDRIWEASQAMIASTEMSLTPGGLDEEDSWRLENLVRGSLLMAFRTSLELNASLTRLQASRVTTREEVYRRLRKAEERIHSEYQAPLSLSDLARTARMGKYHFARRFSEFYGRTPLAMITQLRLNRARTLLRTTNQPISEVAIDCGYNSFPTFIRTFKRFLNLTPGEFREISQR